MRSGGSLAREMPEDCVLSGAVHVLDPDVDAVGGVGDRRTHPASLSS